MKIIECGQGSVEWWEARRGIPTSSSFSRILTPVRWEFSSQAQGYCDELIGDIVNQSPNWFADRTKPPNQAVADGIAREAESKRWYARSQGAVIREVGFCLSDDGLLGCSPDALVGEDGILESKNPMLKTHLSYLRKRELPIAYRTQVHGQLIVTGRKWVDFLSYAPPLEAFILRVYPDAFTVALRNALKVFLEMFAEQKHKLGLDKLAEGELLTAFSPTPRGEGLS